MSEYNDRIAAAAQALGMPTEEFKSDYQAKIGLETVQELDDPKVSKFTDFAKRYEDRFPIGKIRKAFAALSNGRTEEGQAEQRSSDPRLEQLKALGLKVRIDDADTAILLPFYDPAKPSDPVTNVLKKRFGDKKVIAFKDDGKVAIEECLRYISDLEQGFPPAANDAIMIDGKLTELWAIGARPSNMVEEDPLFPGRPLRNGYSSVNGRNWSKVDHMTRQFCRVIVDLGHINVENREAVLKLMERAADKTLEEAYPEAALELRKLAKKDALPKLKVELGSETTKANNPFGIPRRY